MPDIYFAPRVGLCCWLRDVEKIRCNKKKTILSGASVNRYGYDGICRSPPPYSGVINREL